MQEVLKFLDVAGNVPAILYGVLVWFLVRCVISGFFVVGQNQRAVLTTFGRAQRLGDHTTLEDPIAAMLNEDERGRYAYPQVWALGPGIHFKWPWQRVHAASLATQTASMAWDPETPSANQGGQVLEAVTKDQLDIGLTGQIRWKVSERNLYAFLFGVKNPVAYIMGYFAAVLRERIATFEAPAVPVGVAVPAAMAVQVSINDLRTRLAEINHHMEQECRCSAARYGVDLDASLITGINPPQDVETALAAINTAHNSVAADISVAQAAADQRIEESKRAVEIRTLQAQAEVDPLLRLYEELLRLQGAGGTGALRAYVDNLRVGLYRRAKKAFVVKGVARG